MSKSKGSSTIFKRNKERKEEKKGANSTTNNDLNNSLNKEFPLTLYTKLLNPSVQKKCTQSLKLQQMPKHTAEMSKLLKTGAKNSEKETREKKKRELGLS